MINKSYSIELLIGYDSDSEFIMTKSNLEHFVELFILEQQAAVFDVGSYTNLFDAHLYDITKLTDSSYCISLGNLQSYHEAEVAQRQLLEFLEKRYA